MEEELTIEKNMSLGNIRRELKQRQKNDDKGISTVKGIISKFTNDTDKLKRIHKELSQLKEKNKENKEVYDELIEYIDTLLPKEGGRRKTKRRHTKRRKSKARRKTL